MKRIILVCVFVSSLTAFCAAQSFQAFGEPFRQEGIASWYGAEFDGRLTASGEPFDSSRFTAAHPVLPFGTFLKVTNKHNNYAVTVRVNDRGPFVPARIIDLSRAAAELLDMLNTGTAPVLIEVLPSKTAAAPVAPPEVTVFAAPTAPPEVAVFAAPAAPAAPSEAAWQEAALAEFPAVPASLGAVEVVSAPVPWVPAVTIIGGIVPQPGNAKIYRLQVGAYKMPRNAVGTLEKLKNAGLNPAYERNRDLYRVVLPGVKAEDMPQITEKLKAAGFTQAVIREE
ncbi:MAG: septal ring lytic transglycosylase RlpA family protein [Treponema sp.]|jgi:rare lipoprotein A|nr:septal ring lytic transglycosylase RlpA family protein [Treponema sp.]